MEIRIALNLIKWRLMTRMLGLPQARMIRGKGITVSQF
jgi:hypothetical protein